MKKYITLADYIVKIDSYDTNNHRLFVKEFGDKCEINTKNVGILYDSLGGITGVLDDITECYDVLKYVREKTSISPEEFDYCVMSKMTHEQVLDLLVDVFKFVVDLPAHKFYK